MTATLADIEAFAARHRERLERMPTAEEMWSEFQGGSA